MRLALALSTLALFACDLGRNRNPDERPDVFNASTVTGVVSFPDGLENAEQACKALAIEATSGSSKQFGRPNVHQSRNRCSYQLSDLPSDADLSLKAKADGWVCRNGAPVTFSPDEKRVTLKHTETRTLDFTAKCDSARSSR